MPVRDDLGKRTERLNIFGMNYQNCKMKIVEYNSANDISVQFQDNYCAVVKSAYRELKNGKVKNPYYPEVYDIGIIGQKYHAYLNSKEVLEYKIWHSILQRCYRKML